jgi:alcohol dehydrogenase YqhD (iron-dependent ADH family)
VASTTLFYNPIKLVFGVGSVEKVGEEAAKLGKRALIVTGGASTKKSGLLDKVVADMKAKGLDVTVFSGVTPNPRSTTVDAGVKVAVEKKIDLIVGLGGGSAMDASKALRMAYSGGRPVFEYYTGAADPKEVTPKAALMMVPTMAATGSEFNNWAVVTNWETHEKRAIGVPIYFPSTSVVDPALTLTMPVAQVAKGGVDIFLHVMENYIMQEGGAPLADGIRESIMKVAVDSLPVAVKDTGNLDARTNLSWASSLACSPVIVLGGGGGWRPIHLIEHPLSGYFDIGHGDGLSALLPHWLRQSMKVRGDRIAKMAKNVFGADREPVAAVEKWLATVGMTMKLRPLGVTDDKFEEIAQAALDTSRGLLAKDAVHNSVETIAALYRAAY